MIDTLLPLILSASLAVPGATDPQASLGNQAVSKQDSVQATAFLTLLAAAWTPRAEQGGYDRLRAGPLDVPKLASFFASSGVTFSDVNRDSTWRVDARALRRQLNQRRGSGFDMLTRLGFIYDLRRPEYAALSFRYDQGRLIATVGTSSWYRVTFVHDENGLRVANIDYVKRADE